MKKRQLFLYALSLSVSAAAFGGVSVFADSDYSSQTITAKVTDIDRSRTIPATPLQAPRAHLTAMLRPRRKNRMTTVTPLRALTVHPTAMLRPRRRCRMMSATVWISSPQAMTL